MPEEQRTRTKKFSTGLLRVIRAVRKDPMEDKVHKLRTTLRRLEAVAANNGDIELDPKLLKQLGKLRKLAGKVRDMDVQSRALASLNVGSRINWAKSTIQNHLQEERRVRSKKLLKQLDDDRFEKLKKRLAKTHLLSPSTGINVSAYERAMRMLNQVASDFRIQIPNALTVDNLHAVRLRCKQVRYTAELAGEHEEAQRLVESLKKVQDEIGEWHDWSELTDLAIKLISEEDDRTIISALTGVRNSKFRSAADITREIIGSFLHADKKAPRAAVAPASRAARTA